jgi:hypothetical protein
MIAERTVEKQNIDFIDLGDASTTLFFSKLASFINERDPNSNTNTQKIASTYTEESYKIFPDEPSLILSRNISLISPSYTEARFVLSSKNGDEVIYRTSKHLQYPEKKLRVTSSTKSSIEILGDDENLRSFFELFIEGQ